jgi:hypothetical protein
MSPPFARKTFAVSRQSESVSTPAVRPGASTILHTTPDRGIGQQSQSVAGTTAAERWGSLSLTVRADISPEESACQALRRRADRVSRISVPHGLSNRERKLLAEAMHWLRGRGPGIFITVEAGRSPNAEPMVRDLVRRLRSDLVQRQRRAGMRWGLLVTVFEALGRDGRPKFNAHVIMIISSTDGRDRLIKSLHRSAVYGRYVDARPVADWSRLTGYLLKEATPQAWFGAGKSFRRIRGSIPLGELGGDRVVLSRDLKAMLIDCGRVAQFRRTYASRQSLLPEPVSNCRVQLRMANQRRAQLRAKNEQV